MSNAGDVILAADFPTAVSDLQSANGTTTSTTYTPTLTGATAAGVAFVAPTSGKVLITNNARMVNSAANETYCGFTLRTGASVGSGTVVTAAADERSIIHVGTAIERQAVGYLVTGLTPGASYNVQQEFRVSAGTGTYAYRLIIVTPTT